MFNLASKLIQRLRPKKVRTQIIWLVLLSILVTQISTFMALNYYRSQLVNPVTAHFMVDLVNTLRTSLNNIPQQERERFVSATTHGRWRLELRTRDPERQLITPEQRSERDATHEARRRNQPFWVRWQRSWERESNPRQMIRSVNELLGNHTRVWISRGDTPSLFISLNNHQVDDSKLTQEEWLVIPMQNLNIQPNSTMVGIWTSGLVVCLLIGAWFSWYITRPLSRLTRATDKLAEGQPTQVTPAGPQETQRLGERFNAMLDSLQETEQIHKTLLAGLPHDLKGPLTRMRFRTELMDDGPVKEGLQQDTQDMQSIVEQFIAYVRGTDSSTYHFEQLDLCDWLTQKLTHWQETGVAVNLRLPDDESVHIQGDALALSRLVDNLIHNALTYGAPPIDVSLSHDIHTVYLTVRDHGIGVPTEYLMGIFQPFSRLDKARSKTGNVGLGLALVQAITHAHQGKIQGSNHPDGGFCIKIELPRLQ